MAVVINENVVAIYLDPKPTISKQWMAEVVEIDGVKMVELWLKLLSTLSKVLLTVLRSFMGKSLDSLLIFYLFKGSSKCD